VYLLQSLVSVSVAIIFMNQIYHELMKNNALGFYMRHFFPFCQCNKTVIVEDRLNRWLGNLICLLFCREWVIFCLQYYLWWRMNQRHFGVLSLWWNVLDPILIVTKMACTLNFLHYPRFISCSISPWQAAYTRPIVNF